MSPCIACGKPTKERSKLCSRVKCVQARGLRRAQAVAGMNEKIKNAKPATEQEPRPKHIIEAETSAGTRVAKTKNEIDADDLRDVADRSKPAKRTPVDERPKQPAYLKSVAQPIIPSADPEAPYGRDENDRPIGVPVGKPYVKPELKAEQVAPSGSKPCGDCGQQLCKHCHPENIVQTDVLKQITRVPVTLDSEGNGRPAASDLEENVRRQFGLPSPPAFTFAATPPKATFDSYP